MNNILNHLPYKSSFRFVDNISLLSEEEVRGDYTLKKDAFFYEDHFAGNPVTPGVIFLQIVHELTQLHLKKTIQLIELSGCKFLKIVNPEKENVVVISAHLLAEKQALHLKAIGKNGPDNFLKLNALYRTANS